MLPLSPYRRPRYEGDRVSGKIEVACSMLADGFSAATIMKYTGLNESSILSLR
jgi:hypothetical protein